MKVVKALAATGMLGSGFKETSLKKGLSWKPDFIGCDAGSTDSGPYFLGSGETHFSHDAIKRDLRLILLGAINNKIPVIIGSAGTGGTDVHVKKVISILHEIVKEENIHFRLGTIYSDIKKEYLKSKLKNGQCKPLINAPLLTEKIIDDCSHIVGMAGVEPFIECLDDGCDVIIAGRSSDTSIYAAFPIKEKLPLGPVWHSAKILECGAACVAQRKYPDCLFASIDEAGFSIEPPNQDYYCTPLSVASHMLYENNSAFKLIEPSGTLDTSKAIYDAIDTRSVRVEGSLFEPSEKYSIKLEGARLAGYQSMILGGVRDPIILKQLDSWLNNMEQDIQKRFVTIYGEEIQDKYSMLFRVYGRDAVMGELEPIKTVGHEVGIVIEIIASTETLARSLSSVAGHIAVHYPVPEWSGLITSLAYPNSPAEVYVGPKYEFKLNHIVYPDNYKDIFSTQIVDI